MTDRASKLLEEVLWTAEIERRAREAMADPDSGTPWETARDGILAELRSRRP